MLAWLFVALSAADSSPPLLPSEPPRRNPIRLAANPDLSRDPFHLSPHLAAHISEMARFRGGIFKQISGEERPARDEVKHEDGFVSPAKRGKGGYYRYSGRYSNRRERSRSRRVRRARTRRSVSRRPSRNHRRVEEDSLSSISSSDQDRTHRSANRTVRRKKNATRRYEDAKEKLLRESQYNKPREIRLEYVSNEARTRELSMSPLTSKKVLYVGNIPEDFRNTEMRKLGEPYGELEKAFVVNGWKAVKAKWRFGFLIYKDLKGAQRAVDELNAYKVDGYRIVVEPAYYNSRYDGALKGRVLVDD
ncbi:hypothetical protein AAMO2058_001112600 [Amorphochlora amoebiformis]